MHYPVLDNDNNRWGILDDQGPFPQGYHEYLVLLVDIANSLRELNEKLDRKFLREPVNPLTPAREQL